MEKGFDHLIKLLVVGDSGVGKSALLLRLSDDKFTPNYVTTIGIDYRTKIVDLDTKKIKLQIWDTAGQERFKYVARQMYLVTNTHRTITQAYYRGAMGILLIYDVTSTTSFDNIRNWVASLEQYADENINKILIGNKCDMADKRAVPTSKGQELADEYGIKFLETSAKSDINVEEAFLTLAADCKKRLFPNGTPSTSTGGVDLTKINNSNTTTPNATQGGCPC